MPDFSPDLEDADKSDQREKKQKNAEGVVNASETRKKDIENKIQGFLSNYENDNLYHEYLREYHPNPKSFFTQENLERLQKRPTEERLVLLGHASKSLQSTPSLASTYFNEFTSDLKTIEEIFIRKNGFSEISMLNHIFKLAITEMENIESVSKSKKESFQKAAERKELAVDHLLDLSKKNSVSSEIAEFGEPAEGYIETIKKARSPRLRVNSRVEDFNPQAILTEEFKDLPPERKAELLRLCVADIQESLLFNEVHNSNFDREEARRRAEIMNEKAGPLTYSDRSHSILFHSEFSRSIYSNDYSALFGIDPLYRLLRVVIKELSKTDDSVENTRLLIEFWDKNRNPVLTRPVFRALSKQKPEFAAKKLMKKIRQDESPDKTALAAVLYRIELGRIGVSEDGVKYLERRYDLKELNDPDFFAKRLTGKGQMGVFDEEEQMKGMFNLGDLTDGKKEIQAEVYDLTYEMLFVPKEDESEEERKRREQVLEEFKKHYFDFYGEEFHEQTGVYFNNLDLREQGAFMQFAREADDEQTEAAMNVAKKYGESGLQSFVAHAENPNMGKMLLEIADSLPDAAAQSVFREYAGFVEVVNDLESYVADEFNVEDPDRLGNRVANAILERGEKLLRSARADKSDYDELSSTLSDLANSTLVFLHGLKELRQSDQPLDPELLEKSEMNRTDADSITDQEFAQMKDIYKRNYPQNKYDSAIQESLLSRLRDIRASKNGEFYTLKYKGDIKAFLGLKEGEAVDGRPTKQAAAFNVDPEFQNFAVGHMMIENALVREADSSVLIANSNARSTLTAHYIERGFVGTRTSDQHGSEVLDIVWDKPQNNRYRFKYSSIDKIKETFTQHADTESAAKLETGEVITKKDSWEQIDLNQYLPGKVVTRAFSDEGKWYVVFEPAPDTEYPESMK